MAPGVEKRHMNMLYICIYVQYMYSVIIWLFIYSTNMLGNHNA